MTPWGPGASMVALYCSSRLVMSLYPPSAAEWRAVIWAGERASGSAPFASSYPHERRSRCSFTMGLSEACNRGSGSCGAHLLGNLVLIVGDGNVELGEAGQPAGTKLACAHSTRFDLRLDC